MDSFDIKITSKAQSDLSECISFVLHVSSDAAIDLLNDFYSSIHSLEKFPERNPIFEMPKSFPVIIRKHVINNRYIALYSVENNTIVVYRVIDSRRKFDYLIK